MFGFDHSDRSSLPADFPSGIKSKLRALHFRSRSFSKSEPAPASPQPSFDDTDEGQDFESHPSYVVAWGDGSPPSTLLPGAHAMARSVSSPLLSTRYKADIYPQAAYTSSQPLRLDSRYAAPDVPPFFAVKPLSPIAEQDYISPDMQSMVLPADDMVASTPTGSQYSGIARPSPVYSTFITRQLNRSVSQTSSRTQVSTCSVPPSIPPLDLRPSFSGHISVPPLRMPKSAVLRTMPTIEGSSEAFAGAGDDGSSLRAESFLTAESVELNSRGTRQDSSSGGRSGGRDSGPFGGSISAPSSRHANHSSMPSIASQARSTRSAQSSVSSTSFFERRWRRSESYGSGLAISSFPKTPKPLFGSSLTPACWLFLLGFIAPWCWMIGGWYYTIRGQRPRYRYRGKQGQKDPVLPMWVMTKKGLGGIRLTEKEAHSQGVWFGYPFVATAIDNDFEPSLTSLRSPPIIRTKRPRVLDPWIFRCRVAAFVSGFLLMIGFIVAFVVIRHKYG